MLKHIASRGYLLFILLFLLSSPVAQAFSNMYVFGDSLSDSGNLASIIGPFPEPPYYMNRVSNGPVAVDILAASLGLEAAASLHLVGQPVGTNYAVASARASGDEPINLSNQIQAFLFFSGNRAPADALYVMFIGGNDLRDARDAPDKAAARAVIARAVTAIDIALRDLIAAGARHIMVVNAPDIGGIPETSLLVIANDDKHVAKRATWVGKRFNRLLAKHVHEIEHDTGVDMIDFDLFGFIRAVIANAEMLEFTNTTDACFSLATFSFHPDCNFGANFDQFVFFDEEHVTARVSAMAGLAMFETLPTLQPLLVVNE